MTMMKQEALMEMKIATLERALARLQAKEKAQESLIKYEIGKNIKNKKLKPEERDERLQMKGYNTAIERLNSLRVKASDWYDVQPVERQLAIASLLRGNQIELNIDQDLVGVWIDVREPFKLESAVLDVTSWDIIHLSEAYVKFESSGTMAFVAHKLGTLPLNREIFGVKYPQFEEALVWMGK